MKDRERTHKEVGLVGAVLILLMILFIMVMGKLVLNFDTGMLVLIVAMATTIVYVGVYRFTWDFMFKEGVIPMVARASGAILILLIVGPMIAIWMAAGTVPYMINFGLSILRPQTFLVSACLVCAISSVLTGTSWGSAAGFRRVRSSRSRAARAPPEETSAPGSPCSTIRPESKTITWSADMMLSRRWAMTTIVRRGVSDLRVPMMWASECRSTFEVGSSSSSTGVRRISARARARRCR